MTAVCSLCGELIRSLIVYGQVSPEDNGRPAITKALQAVQEIAEFDQLSAEMFAHIIRRHPAQANEMGEVAATAGRVYAMTWTTATDDDKFSALRTAWRKGVLQRLNQEAGRAPEGKDSSSSSSSGTGSGSGE